MRHDQPSEPDRTGGVGMSHAASTYKQNRHPTKAGQAPAAINEEAKDLSVAQCNHGRMTVINPPHS